MSESQPDRFVLENFEQVETAYIAAHIADDAPELHFQLKFLKENLHPQDQIFEAIGPNADFYRQQAVNSLKKLSADQDYYQYAEAAGHLLCILGADQE